ncbi:hypothetical protein Q9L42_004460 [Methylomarinum sp. Ch1-1]|uniref:Lipoprotein n=1 Tax=Methylomarinum roseum TaxID=3067653 RepID=A0AAU7NWN7_9GAMM|nr:hypothetical protein [Methylomarinum sp. Ch1-1]MDP4522553.1 hypothetical protein [Methylomarinum sp. Ch1-1]
MGCCDDPTEPVKVNRSDLVQVQERYGNLQRELFTGDPEKVMAKELRNANTYLLELAALRAHYASVRKQAIALLEKSSQSVLERISEAEANSEIGLAAKQRLEQLANDKGLFGNLFKGSS